MDTQVKVLEAQIRELNRTLDYEKKHNTEAKKQIYKRDRIIRDLTLEGEEYKEKLKDALILVHDLENDLKIYKRKLEESQDTANQTSTRLRKAHQKYLDEVVKTEQFEEQSRRRKAEQQQTSVFFQV